MKVIHSTATHTGDITLKSNETTYDGEPETIYIVFDGYRQHRYAGDITSAKNVYLRLVNAYINESIDLHLQREIKS